ncbi:DNA helicase IV [Vibrio sonorensis]|uniref:DNA helicase IV n=1 Tax=Vibrio sonorensis TaxID=1004316 RepID=UPI0008DAB179|nr:DNA helicase IV [Vibrio sonorensis]
MQLNAKTTARFFVQDEFHHVEIANDTLVLHSETIEERIPFTKWNGQVRVIPGLFWFSLQFFGHIERSKQQTWLVQGLPPVQSKAFAKAAIDVYGKWHNNQCQQLANYLPKWESAISGFKRQPSYLKRSATKAWVEEVSAQFNEMNMTLDEAVKNVPKRMEPISNWLTENDACTDLRNSDWIEQERANWEVLFNQVESSPLNHSQQCAVLLNDDHNLVLAGAGSGKTSVLTARVAYLLQSHLARAEEILLLAFGSDAAQEMKDRLNAKIGIEAEKVNVHTFHQLGLKILNSNNSSVTLSPMASDEGQRKAWCIDWLKKHWMTPTNYKRWQKHLNKWPIAYLSGDEDLGSHSENPKLIGWLLQQLDQLCSVAISKKQIQEQMVSHSDYSRLNSELNLIWPCYQAWNQQLKEQDKIDFNLMISNATQLVKKNKFTNQWKYIMVDEYQDISPKRLELIESLCLQNSKDPSVLFAVGDDWQSIYQFAGSKVDLTTGFSERFPNSSTHYLDTTYRFPSTLGDVANGFITQNPNQLEKPLNSYKVQKQKSVTVSKMKQVEKVLDTLNRKDEGSKVLILGRNHYHKPELMKDWIKQYSTLDIGFMTCHASKGQEADYVIIVNVDEGQFPARVKAPHVSDVLTSNGDDFAYAEERRLFYVALTRAKKHVWVCYNGSGSVFVKELLSDYPVIKR